MTLIAELRQSQLAALKLPKVGVATAAVSDTFPMATDNNISTYVLT